MAKIVNFVQALIIFFSLIVLATSDHRVFCSTTNDCQYNDCGPAYVPECVLIIFLSLIVLATSDYRVFCSTNDDCKHNECGAAYVPECLWIVCTCQPRLKSN
ncbi:hypothetical protein P8452_45364 [Trifolium repens]|nr:hypothetical protein P8452_45364 [Trifolium repens]